MKLDGVAVSRDHDYDEQSARQVINYTEAAYCTDDLVGWNCTVCYEFPGMMNVSVLQGKSRNVRGFIGIDLGSTSAVVESEEGADFLSLATDRDSRVETGRRRQLRPGVEEQGLQGDDLLPSPRVVVTFSGTDPKSMKNWIDDLEAAPTAHPYGKGDCDDCKVHSGFLAAYEIVQDQVRAEVSDHLRHNPTAAVVITGHSLGGALATLCFLDLFEYLGASTDPAKSAVTFAPLHIFGAPRVGNAAFAAFMVSRGVPIFRLVHHRDPVPHLPFTSWGYMHPSTEIFYSHNQTDFTVCDGSGEDPYCSDQFWVLSNFAYISDHLRYLEVEYPNAYLNCLFGGDDPGDWGDQEERKEEAAAWAIEREWEELGKELTNRVSDWVLYDR